MGIADAPYDTLSESLRATLTEYFKVDNLEDYNQVYRAVAYFAFKYGKIDWIESNNEYWLEQDARLRTDFNVTTGIRADHIHAIKEKSEMKKYYAKGNIPTARQVKGNAPEARIWAFAKACDYPLIAKPDVGVGASGTYKLHNDQELADFLHHNPVAKGYVIEEFITGEICSYDAIDMMDFAHSTDVYQIWADMVAFGARRAPEGEPHYCAFASRRDIYRYQHSHEEVLARYGQAMVMCERMPEIFSAAMGNQMYTVKLDRFEDVQAFIAFVHAKQRE